METPNGMNEFIQKVIKRGLENGLTPEQIMANPQAAAQAYIDAEERMLQEAAAEVRKQILG